jgi:hypothetical protein
MNRDRLINIALFIAGILLAIALFSAGAIWRSRSIHHNVGNQHRTQFDADVEGLAVPLS